MKLKRWLWRIAVLVLVICCRSQQTAQARPRDEAPAQQFVCNTGYTLEKCRDELAALKKVVAKYPTAALGQWTWVLVRSQDWQAVMRRLRLDPNRPAFSCLETRVTFIEEALVGEVHGRRVDLVTRWHMGMDSLLDLTVRHELGHAFCDERDETKAQRLAILLEQQRPISCESKSASKDRGLMLKQ